MRDARQGNPVADEEIARHQVGMHVEVLHQPFELLDQAFVARVVVRRVRQHDVAVAIQRHAIVRIGQILRREPEVE